MSFNSLLLLTSSSNLTLTFVSAKPTLHYWIHVHSIHCFITQCIKMYQFEIKWIFNFWYIQKSTNTNNSNRTPNLLGLSHFFCPSSSLIGGWAHFGYLWLSCSWILMIWFIRLVHLATIIAPSPSWVDAAHQYIWLMMLLIHCNKSPQSFWIATFSN